MSEYQGNDDNPAHEDEEVAMPTADTTADRPSLESTEDDETTWED